MKEVIAWVDKINRKISYVKFYGIMETISIDQITFKDECILLNEDVRKIEREFFKKAGI